MKPISYALLLLTLSCPLAAGQELIDLLPVGPAHDHAFAGFGTDIARVGDLDSDGFTELAVLASGSIQYVRIVSGKDGRPLRTFLLGDVESLEPIADFDGDGVADFLTGEPEYSVGALDRGRVRVISTRTGLQLLSLVGGSAGDRFGTALADAGDVDGDGRSDVLVGAPRAATGGPTGGADKGRVYLYSGASGAELAWWSKGGGDALFGTSLAVLDDIDGNGKPLVAVGAPGNGMVFVFELLSTSPGLTVDGGGSFGSVVAAIGNFDGLGGRDVAVCDPGFDYTIIEPFGPDPTFPNAGRVSFVSSSTGQVIDAWSPTISNVEAGRRLLDVGDVTGDGIGDVLIASRPPGTGLFGPTPQNLWVASGAEILAGNVDADLLFSSVNTFADFARAGDRDGDGREDLWFGRPTLSGPDANAGAAHLSSVQDYDILVESGGHLGTGIGDAVAILDDLDGDGRAEVAVGAPHDGPGGLLSRGTLRVLSGTQLLWSVDGAIAEELGAAVAKLDDLDGDGYCEVLVGIPNGQVGIGRRGKAQVLSGIDGSPVRTHLGALSGERFGDAVCAVPDVDGDGVDDYAIAAPEATTGFLRAGRVVVFSGANGVPLSEAFGVSGRFGTAIAGSEDLNGDGAGDLIVGAPFAFVSAQAFGAGSVHRVSGATGLEIGANFGTQALERMGSSVASVGDLSGDGVADFLVGSPLYNNTATDDGRVQLRSGANGSVLWTGVGAVGSEFGSAIASIGDVDFDGVPDFAVGEPEALDFASFFVKGQVRFYSGADFAWIRSVLPTASNTRFGESLAGGGDLDGDGLFDLVAGAPFGDADGQPACGRALTYTQRALGTTIYGQATASCAEEHTFLALDPVDPGDTLELRFAGLAPGTLPILLGCLAPTASPVPLANGALLNVDLALQVLVQVLPPSTGSFVTAPLPIPNNPLLVGLSLYFQGAALWPAPCPALPLGLSTSRGLAVTVQ
ncbi:MAG: hypothetical protein GC161_16620 [Planctomycetaceae bacterium]|nr:hypothetical protein [Planctomycetaceae bacterium]